jgi:predicted MPP superfamily phosphohydrolase
MHLYVFWRAASVPVINRYVSRKLLIAAGIALGAVCFGVRVFASDGMGAIAGVLELFLMTWMAILFLVSVALFVVDLFTGFGYMMRRQVHSLRGLALVAGGVLSIVALVQGLRPPVVESYEVRLSALPSEMDGTVIVAMSDLHLGSILGEQWLAARMAQVEQQRPDLVVFLGDVFEGHGQPNGSLLPVLRRFQASLGVWAVSGNHESHGGLDTGVSLMEQAGIRVLRNQSVEVRPGLVIAGMEDLTTLRRSGRAGDLIGKTIDGRPPGAVILLSHTPGQAERAAKAGVGLMLNGHTHGGQIWPLGYLTRFFQPLLDGRYDVNGMPIIVCRGTGTWGPRMRLWQPGEILRVTLRGMNSQVNTKLHSKTHRGDDEEPTQAHMEVRRGARRGDNEGESMKATWYKWDDTYERKSRR